MRKRTHKISDVHSDWLTQVDVEGPFLAYPVLKDMWPNGVDRLSDSDDRLLRFKQASVQWQRSFDQYAEHPKTPESKAAYDTVRRDWIDIVLDDIAEWADLRADAVASGGLWCGPRMGNPPARGWSTHSPGPKSPSCATPSSP